MKKITLFLWFILFSFFSFSFWANNCSLSSKDQTTVNKIEIQLRNLANKDQTKLKTFISKATNLRDKYKSKKRVYCILDWLIIKAESFIKKEKPSEIDNLFKDISWDDTKTTSNIIDKDTNNSKSITTWVQLPVDNVGKSVKWLDWYSCKIADEFLSSQTSTLDFKYLSIPKFDNNGANYYFRQTKWGIYSNLFLFDFGKAISYESQNNYEGFDNNWNLWIPSWGKIYKNDKVVFEDSDCQYIQYFNIFKDWNYSFICSSKSKGWKFAVINWDKWKIYKSIKNNTISVYWNSLNTNNIYVNWNNYFYIAQTDRGELVVVNNEKEINLWRDSSWVEHFYKVGEDTYFYNKLKGTLYLYKNSEIIGEYPNAEESFFNINKDEGFVWVISFQEGNNYKKVLLKNGKKVFIWDVYSYLWMSSSHQVKVDKDWNWYNKASTKDSPQESLLAKNWEILLNYAKIWWSTNCNIYSYTIAKDSRDILSSMDCHNNWNTTRYLVKNDEIVYTAPEWVSFKELYISDDWNNWYYIYTQWTKKFIWKNGSDLLDEGFDWFWIDKIEGDNIIYHAWIQGNIKKLYYYKNSDLLFEKPNEDSSDSVLWLQWGFNLVWSDVYYIYQSKDDNWFEQEIMKNDKSISVKNSVYSIIKTTSNQIDYAVVDKNNKTIQKITCTK